jgi:D-galactonate transporter
VILNTEKSVLLEAETYLRSSYRRIDLRILPFLAICYLFSYLDRINIGFAKLQMQSDLGFSDAVYGLGAGIFFLGYMLFEVPSNLLLAKIGARKTLSRILILWGLVSASMLFVNDITTFYFMRFLLGVFEAGFAPGMILYLTYWYSDKRMARAIALVLCAAPVGGMVGGPVSTWLMTAFSESNGLAGWQWMFLVEGLPAILLGAIAFFYLDDKPSDAKWLSDREKSAHAADIGRTKSEPDRSFVQLLRNPRIYGFAATYFCLICGLYAVGFWLPTILKAAGLADLMIIGLFSAIPYGAAIFAMYLLSVSSDRRGERHWHSALATVAGALALAVAAFTTSSFAISLISISVATALMFAAYSVFWAIPTDYLKGEGAAGGIALVNSIGLFGGFLSPTIIGWVKTTTGSLQIGLMVIVCLLVFGAALTIFLQRRQPMIAAASAL